MDSFWPWVGIFIAIAIFLGLILFFLLVLRQTLIRVQGLISEVELKLDRIDPALKLVGNIGETLDHYVDSFKRLSEASDELLTSKKKEVLEEKSSTVVQLAELAMVGVSLWNKFKERRR